MTTRRRGARNGLKRCGQRVRQPLRNRCEAAAYQDQGDVVDILAVAEDEDDHHSNDDDDDDGDDDDNDELLWISTVRQHDTKQEKSTYKTNTNELFHYFYENQFQINFDIKTFGGGVFAFISLLLLFGIIDERVVGVSIDYLYQIIYDVYATDNSTTIYFHLTFEAHLFHFGMWVATKHFVFVKSSNRLQNLSFANNCKFCIYCQLQRAIMNHILLRVIQTGTRCKFTPFRG